MKSVLRFLLILVVLLGGAFFAGPLFLPDRASASRTVEIAAPPEDVWPLVSDLNQFNTWSPWAERDPEMTVTVAGAPGSVGHSMTWSSTKQGDGTLTVAEVRAPNLLRSDLDFGPNGTASAVIEIEPSGAGSSVTWAFESQLEGPMQHWFGLVLPDMIGADYEQGLANLKAVAER